MNSVLPAVNYVVFGRHAANSLIRHTRGTRQVSHLANLFKGTYSPFILIIPVTKQKHWTSCELWLIQKSRVSFFPIELLEFLTGSFEHAEKFWYIPSNQRGERRRNLVLLVVLLLAHSKMAMSSFFLSLILFSRVQPRGYWRCSRSYTPTVSCQFLRS